MNNVIEKVKQYFSSNFGKLAGIITGLSFIITFVLSVLYKNRIDISLFKAIFSAIITIVILFLLGLVLKKYLGDVIDESNTITNSDIDYSAIDDNNISDEPAVSNDNTSDSIEVPFTPDLTAPSPKMNVDKKPKTDYYSSGDDIGDIVFGKSNSSSPSYSSTSTMFPDKKVNDNEIIKEAQEDPEKVAKAVRTMIAKDEKDDNK